MQTLICSNAQNHTKKEKNVCKVSIRFHFMQKFCLLLSTKKCIRFLLTKVLSSLTTFESNIGMSKWKLSFPIKIPKCHKNVKEVSRLQMYTRAISPIKSGMAFYLVCNERHIPHSQYDPIMLLDRSSRVLSTCLVISCALIFPTVHD